MASSKKRVLELVKGSLKAIIQAKQKANSAEYFKLLDKVKIVEANINPDELKFWLWSLGQNVSSIIEFKCDELLNLILFKCPWLVPGTTHYKCFDRFIQFSLHLFSNKSLYIPPVLRHLLSSFTSPLEQVLSSPIALGRHKFSSIDSVKQKVLEITSHITDDCEEITDSDTKAFLLDLFSKHQNSAQKLGRDHSPRILYGRNKTFKGKTTNCFYLEHSNGTKEDISYLKCIAGLRDELVVSRTLSLQALFEKSGNHLVNFITKVCQEFVLSQPQVLQVLAERFPYKKLKVEQQYLYFKMMTELAAKCERAEEQILAICLDRFLQIDADIESTGHSSSSKAVIITDTQLVEEKLRRSSTRIYPEPEIKVNALLDVLINYLDKALARIASINSSEDFEKQTALEEYIDLLLKLFEEKVIPAHKTNYIQYLLLYLFSRADLEIFREKFLSLLFLQSFNEKLFIGSRLRYLNYLASFMASAKNSGGEVLVAAMKMILEKVSSSNLKFRTHVIQSLLYTICYKWAHVETNTLPKEIFDTILKNYSKSLPYIEGSILVETVLLLQKADNVKYSEEIVALDKAIAEQKEKHIHPVNAYFLFTMNTASLPIIETKMKDAVEQYTYRQTVGIREKSNSFNTTNSGSVESAIGSKKGKKRRDKFILNQKKKNGVQV